MEKIGTVQVAMTSPDEKFGALSRAMEALKAAVTARGEKTADWPRQIETLSGGRIRADLYVDGGWSDIREAVDQLSAKSGSQAESRQTQVTEQITAGSP